MKTISVAMQAHLDGACTTLATCIAVTRTDGVELFATTFNRTLTIDGDDYAPLGFLRSDTTVENDMDVPSSEVTGVLDAATITEDDLRAGVWDFAAYELFQVNWADLTMGRIALASGNMGVVRSGRLKFVVELLGLMQAVQNSIGCLNSPACIHELGDNNAVAGRGNGCTVDLAPLTVTGTIDSMDSDYYGLHDSARVEADTYFSNGVMEITSGPMTGMRFEVRAYIVGFWVLFTALPYDGTGETYSMSRGCDKSLETCRDVFNNVEDRLASDYTQGNDAAIQVGRHNG